MQLFYHFKRDSSFSSVANSFSDIRHADLLKGIQRHRTVLVGQRGQHRAGGTGRSGVADLCRNGAIRRAEGGTGLDRYQLAPLSLLLGW